MTVFMKEDHILRLIAERAAYAFGLDYSQMLSPRRTGRNSKARFAAMFLMREHGTSYSKIAAAVGRCDHTTAIHGVIQAEKLIAENEHFAKVVEGIRGEERVQWCAASATPWIKEEGPAIRAFYEGGENLVAASKKFNRSRKAVRKAIIAMGGSIRTPASKCLDGERLEAFAAMRSNGATLEEIGKRYGISRQRVCQIMAKKTRTSSANEE